MVMDALPLAIVLSSLLPGLAIFFLKENWHRRRTILNLLGASLKLLLVVLLLWEVFEGREHEWRYAILPGMDFVLRTDALACLFVSLSALLWFVTTVYAIAYLEDIPHRSRFFGFFSLCVTATMGVAMAGNMLTFLIFYELLTLATYPLIVHKGTEEARRAGRIYLGYTLSGGALLLFGVVWLRALAGPLNFSEVGLLATRDDLSPAVLATIFALIITGLGVKSALVPLHGWLPAAMVAVAPVSALLHAVAVVKAGAFGIVRVVYDVYGVGFAADLGVTKPLMVLASVTILYASVRALFQDDLKRRLAFSTVSQVSYIALGAAIAGPMAAMGGVVHLVHQGLMKITLFFCAGILAKTLGVHKISELDGVGQRMPLTMGAFTLAALGMIGIPPMAGFVSKWYLGVGAVNTGQTWVVAVLVVSSVLNGAYFLPILYRCWFKPLALDSSSADHHGSSSNGLSNTARQGEPHKFEAAINLLWPPLFTVTLALLAGLFAAAPFSPLTWVALIIEREYLP